MADEEDNYEDGYYSGQDEDHYNDDTDHHNEDGDGEDDEQHIQKVSGQIATMQQQIDQQQVTIKTMQHELDRERIEHQKTRFRADHTESKLRDDLTSIHEENSVKSNESDLKKRNSSHDTGDLSSTLKKEFSKFCSKNGFIVNGIENPNAVDDEMCITILRLATKTLKKGRKAEEGATTTTLTGNENESELATRIRNLESELRLALGAAEDIKALKSKLLQMIERIRIEKEHKLKSEQELLFTKKKIEILSDHIEKLMIFLKHEAAAKVRSTESLRQTEREVLRVKDKCDLIQSKSNAKDKFIVELREGSKVLEDQLRLMDEKYLELRTKLDYAREIGLKKVKIAEKKASELRMKFALAGNMTVLDNMPMPMPLPSLSSSAGSNSGYGGAGGSLGSYSSGEDFGYDQQSQSNTSQQRKKFPKSLAVPSSSSGRVSLNSTARSVSDDISLELVNEKLRIQEGGKKAWTEEKVRAYLSAK